MMLRIRNKRENFSIVLSIFHCKRNCFEKYFFLILIRAQYHDIPRPHARHRNRTPNTPALMLSHAARATQLGRPPQPEGSLISLKCSQYRWLTETGILVQLATNASVQTIRAPGIYTYIWSNPLILLLEGTGNFGNHTLTKKDGTCTNSYQRNSNHSADMDAPQSYNGQLSSQSYSQATFHTQREYLRWLALRSHSKPYLILFMYNVILVNTREVHELMINIS